MTIRRAAAPIVLAAGLAALAAPSLRAQPEPRPQERKTLEPARASDQPQRASATNARGAQPGGEADDRPNPMNPMAMAAALRATEGCLGVELGGMMSGKRTIIAWFEDPDAVKRWYHSDMHRALLASMPGAGEPREPLAHIGDYAGPVMVMATVTMGGGIEGIDMPISQISIELYAPLPGGAHINGRLAPEGFRVEHMRDYAAQGG